MKRRRGKWKSLKIKKQDDPQKQHKQKSPKRHKNKKQYAETDMPSPRSSSLKRGRDEQQEEINTKKDKRDERSRKDMPIDRGPNPSLQPNPK